MNESPQPPSSDELDRAAMFRLSNGHDSALNGLMDRHGEPLFHYLVRVLQNETEAGDIAQEAFVRVYQHHNKYDPRQRFSTWLYAIATNLARDRKRWHARHPDVSLDAERTDDGDSFKETLADEDNDPRRCLATHERAEAVREAIGKLPEELRLPLVLSEYEEMSHGEIGTILKCSPKAIETRLYRARQKLRDWLGDLKTA